MPSQSWVALVNGPVPTVDGGPLASSAALTAISPVPDATIRNNTLDVGTVLRCTAFGRLSTTGTPTLLLGAYYGGASGIQMLAGAAPITCGPAGLTNVAWTFEGLFVVRSIGAAGTVIGTAKLAGISGPNNVDIAPATAPTAATIDTTAGKTIVIAAQWGTSSPSNTITCHGVAVELLN